MIGSGVHRPSELAGRLGIRETTLAKPLRHLVELGVVRRDAPYELHTGKPAVGGRRSFYRLADPFLGMWYACVRPHVSGLNIAVRALHVTMRWPPGVITWPVYGKTSAASSGIICTLTARRGSRLGGTGRGAPQARQNGTWCLCQWIARVCWWVNANGNAMSHARACCSGAMRSYNGPCQPQQAPCTCSVDYSCQRYHRGYAGCP